MVLESLFVLSEVIKSEKSSGKNNEHMKAIKVRVVINRAQTEAFFAEIEFVKGLFCKIQCF